MAVDFYCLKSPKIAPQSVKTEKAKVQKLRLKSQITFIFAQNSVDFRNQLKKLIWMDF
jgi:hypothetical protein